MKTFAIVVGIGFTILVIIGMSVAVIEEYIMPKLRKNQPKPTPPWMNAKPPAPESDNPPAPESEDSSAGMAPNYAGADADAHAAREKAGNDPDLCKACAHPLALHPVPYGACSGCLELMKSDPKRYVVCGAFEKA